MTAPIIIKGSLVDVKNINTHKCVRLSIDVSAELGAEIVHAFGWPTMVEPVSVAVARLVPEAEAPPSLAAQIAADMKAGTAHFVSPSPEEHAAKEKRRITQLHGGSQAALTCKREAFWKFLEEQRDIVCRSEEEAAEYVREFCDIKSRSEIETNPTARNRWHLLYSAFDAWMKVPAL